MFGLLVLCVEVLGLKMINDEIKPCRTYMFQNGMNRTVFNHSRILVGAPTADRAPEHSSDLIQPGGLFKCGITTDQSCERVIMNPGAGTNKNYQVFKTISSSTWNIHCFRSCLY